MDDIIASLFSSRDIFSLIFGGAFMREIVLTQGKVALVDDKDFDELNKHRWYAFKHRDTFYACRHGKNYSIVNMSHQILGYVDGKVIDHINRDGLDNRRCNLRFCSIAENCSNSKHRSNNTSGYRGVYWNSHSKKWTVHLSKNYDTMYLGSFDSKEEAGRAYDKKAKELFGDFAVLNFPDSDNHANE